MLFEPPTQCRVEVAWGHPCLALHPWSAPILSLSMMLSGFSEMAFVTLTPSFPFLVVERQDIFDVIEMAMGFLLSLLLPPHIA